MRDSASTLASEISPVELEALTKALAERHLQGKHLEIGTAAGGTLKELMRVYPDANRPPFVVIDPMTYFPDQMETVLRNIRDGGFDPAIIDFRVSFSWPAFLRAESAKESFSFIFVDGSHKIHHVTEDLAWARLLETGGLICFHDYSAKFPGVMQPVDRFLARYRNYRVVALTETLLIVEKVSPSSTAEIGAWDRLLAKIINVSHQLQASWKKRAAGGERL